MKARRHLCQPGPATAERFIALPCTVDRFTLQIPAGRSVLNGIADALAAHDIQTAVLEFSAARLDPLVYVIPAESSDAAHVAWYSAQIRPEGVGRFEQAVMSFGWDGAVPFIHCHGIWHHADGFRGGGHLITDQTVFAEETRVTVCAIRGARLERQPDAETNFSILTPIADGHADGIGTRGLLLRIKPNFDIHAGIEAAARAHGIANGSLHGVISLVDCAFHDGKFMESYASEGFIRQGRLADGMAQLEIGVAAMGGAVFEGQVQRGDNGICIASEILIVEA